VSTCHAGALGEGGFVFKMNILRSMKNVAPAIFPPSGIGGARPANQAVLDWVHEIATLTEPENIFWCDGSDRENEFLIADRSSKMS